MRPAASGVAEEFQRAFHRAPEGVWAAPGRVNLIGEHTDYNDGFVLPLALPQRVLVAAARAHDGHSTVLSLQQPGPAVSFVAGTVEPGDVKGWAAYAAGVFWALRTAGQQVPDSDLVLDGDVPLGAGLSSSAAVECAVIIAVHDLAGLTLSRTALALEAKRAENLFVGAPTGVMDQMAAMHGKPGHLVFLDTRSLALEHVPFNLAGHGLALLMVDTRSSHALVHSEYAERRESCETAARLLGIRALRDVTLGGLDSAFALLPDDVLRRRVRHVVTENARVLEVVGLLRDGVNPRRIGPALTASHVSLRDDFEVTIDQLDVAVDSALAAGAYGARMTGGGFGGCVIALVDEDTLADTGDAVTAAFERAGFDKPDFLVATPSDGAHRLT
jgi:galactokinase